MSGPYDYFDYKKNELQTEGVALARVAERVGTPVYVYSTAALLSPLRELQRGLKGLDALVCFAVKSNSNLSVLRLLAKAGAGMDVVSGGELFRARRAGIPGKKIVFSGVGKTVREIEEALRGGIFSFNVESAAELSAIQSVAARLGKSASVALRFNPDVDAKTHPYISTGLRKNKFGLEKREILALVREYRRFPRVRIRGISIHIGSQLLELAPLADSFARLRSLAGEIEPLLGEPLRFLDLGGGVGISYGDERSPSISAYCALIRKNFSDSKRLLLEPGRLIAGNSGVLLSRVLYRKEKKTKDFLVIDAGMNDLLRPALYGSRHAVVPLLKKPGKSGRSACIVGPVCESADCFAENAALPENLAGGDLIALLSCGAYGFTMASCYNSRPRPPEVLVDRGKFRVIRKRESYADLIQGESS